MFDRCAHQLDHRDLNEKLKSTQGEVIESELRNRSQIQCELEELQRKLEELKIKSEEPRESTKVLGYTSSSGRGKV